MNSERPPEQRRVLVVDDDPFIRKLLLRCLERLGFTAVAVPDGLAALEAIAQNRFDIVILDVDMPGMDGLEVGRRIRDGAARGVAIAMHTTRDELFVRNRFADYDAYLPKPCKPARLKRLVEEAIERRTRTG